MGASPLGGMRGGCAADDPRYGFKNLLPSFLRVAQHTVRIDCTFTKLAPIVQPANCTSPGISCRSSGPIPYLSVTTFLPPSVCFTTPCKAGGTHAFSI